jgi:hypothetical protein
MWADGSNPAGMQQDNRQMKNDKQEGNPGWP